MGGVSGAIAMLREPAVHADPSHLLESRYCVTVVLKFLAELTYQSACIQVSALSAELQSLLVNAAFDEFAVPGPMLAFPAFRPAAVAADLVQVGFLVPPVVQLLSCAQVD